MRPASVSGKLASDTTAADWTIFPYVIVMTSSHVIIPHCSTAAITPRPYGSREQSNLTAFTYLFVYFLSKYNSNYNNKNKKKKNKKKKKKKRKKKKENAMDHYVNRILGNKT